MIGRADPGARLRVQIKSRLLDLELGVGLIDLDGGRQRALMQGHDDLKEAAGAGGGLGVTDLALDRAQGAPLTIGATGLIKDGAQAAKLGGVAGLGAGAVGLDELDGLGAIASALVGAAQGLGLARRDRRIDALGAPIGGRAHAAHDGVDGVAVTLRVCQALHGDHADALAEHGAIGLIREGPAVA